MASHGYLERLAVIGRGGRELNSLANSACSSKLRALDACLALQVRHQCACNLA
jgi:hypothetical protein